MSIYRRHVTEKNGREQKEEVQYRYQRSPNLFRYQHARESRWRQLYEVFTERSCTMFTSFFCHFIFVSSSFRLLLINFIWFLFASLVFFLLLDIKIKVIFTNPMRNGNRIDVDSTLKSNWHRFDIDFTVISQWTIFPKYKFWYYTNDSFCKCFDYINIYVVEFMLIKIYFWLSLIIWLDSQ